MSMRERLPASASDSVDLAATLELLASLTQYAEAGAVQPHTLSQAAQHALEEHGENVEILVAIAKLHMATGDRAEAASVLGRAHQLAPEDHRVSQLLAETGLEPGRSTPASPKPQSFMQRTPASRAASTTSPKLSSRYAETEAASRASPATPRTARPVTPRSGPTPSRGPDPRAEDTGTTPAPVASRPRDLPAQQRESTLRSMRVLAQSARDDAPASSSSRDPAAKKPAARGADTPPATPRPSPAQEGPTQRPTVRMARVSGAPDRQRWGKSPDTREVPDSRLDREPPSEGPRSVRGFQQPPAGPTSMRSPRDAAVASRAARAATGNLKLLDPNDERRHLDRYELIGEIASGGMASVFLARTAGVAGFQRFFAIKRLHPHLADEQEFIDMFLDEARLAAGIHHPNVVPILEVGTTEAGYYLVMDYIEGDTLSGVINRAVGEGGLPRPIALRIMVDSLHGLHAAHELTDSAGNPIDLVHRDCSPQNILVGVDGSSRITDFGVARASSRLSTTRSATVKGKLAYLSPEQATGRGLDRRSDLFGMGVILWEVLAGRRLFRADSDGATLSRILVEPIPSLVEVVPDVPTSLAQIVATSLARDPHDRFATAADMAGAIEQAIRDSLDPELQIASPRDVAAYMREVFGHDIAARREAVRAWTVQCSDGSAQSGPRSQGLRSPAAAAAPPSSRAPSSSRPTAPDGPPSGDLSVSPSEPPSSKTEPSAVHSDDAADSQSGARELRPSTPRSSPVVETVTLPAPGEAGDAPSGAPETSTRTSAKPSPEDASADAPRDASTSLAKASDASSAPARRAPAKKGPPIALILLTLGLILAAIAAFVMRSRGH